MSSEGATPPEQHGFVVKAVCTGCREEQVCKALGRDFAYLTPAGEPPENGSFQNPCDTCGAIPYHNLREVLSSVSNPSMDFRSTPAEPPCSE